MNIKNSFLKLALVFSLIIIPSTHRTIASTVCENNIPINQSDDWTYEIISENMLKNSNGEYLIFETEFN